MKKLLVLLALCMVLSVVLVACQQPDDPTPEESTAGTTEAPTTEAPTTEAPTTEAPTTEEPTTEAPTTEEPTTEEGTTPPPEPVKVIAGKSWDSLTAVPGDAVFSDGYGFMDWEKNPVVEINMATNTLDVWGWVAFFTETEGTVGYKINDGEVVYNSAFTYTAEEGVQTHIANGGVPGAKSACRMKFSIPVATLAAGEYTFALYAKDPAGNEELVLEFKVTKTVPYVNTTDAAAGFNEWSFDGFYANETLYFPEDGGAAGKLEAQNKIVPVAYGTKYNTIGFRGWVSFNQTAEAFGYFISGVNTEIVYGEFLQERPDLEPAGKVNGVGFNIVVPTADLGYGSYNVSIYAKLTDGTIVQLYEITLDVLNLVVDTETKFMCSIDHVNGSGPIKEDGTYDPYFSAIGGTTCGKIDAAVAGKTNDADGIITFGGWCGIGGGVNRYVWSVDGVNWFDVVSGGKDGEPLDGHYNSLNTEEGMTSTKNGMFTSGAFITIQLPKEYVGATGTIYVGAIPEINQGSVIVICELSNFTVSEIVEPKEPNGTLENPLTVGETLAAVADLAVGSVTEIKYFTTGVVTAIGEGGSYYKRVYFTDGENEMLIYTLNPMEGMPELKVGDTITVNGFIKNYDGTIEYASNGSEYVFVVAHKEAPKANVVVDPRTLGEGAITGHMPVIVNAENQPAHFPMIAAAGLTDGAMLHQGSINLGTFTLQDYSKVVIYYATDWGEGTQAGLAAAKEQGFGRLGISAVDCNNVVNPTADHVFVGTQYTPAGGWVITAHEIDLTGIEYTGDIYVSADFLGGQFIIIDRVEFVY